VFLPPVSGRADAFFQQMLALTSLGYRVISVCVLLVILVFVYQLFFFALYMLYLFIMVSGLVSMLLSHEGCERNLANVFLCMPDLLHGIDSQVN